MKTRRRKNWKKAGPVKPLPAVELDVETVCNVCEAEFLDESDLKLHVTQVHMNESNGKTICRFCSTVLSGADAFVSHFIFKHLENLAFCYYCYRTFADQLLLEQHELKHCAVDDISTLTCSQCPNILKNRQELQSHEYNNHRNNDDGFMLNGFFPLLSSALNFKINKFLDYLSKKTPITCVKCGYVSLDASTYIQHLKSAKCQSYACDKCFNTYKVKRSIILHMQNHPECHNDFVPKDIQGKCPKCGKYFSSNVITEHKESCNFVKCSTCDKLFDSIYALADHRIEEHQVKINLKLCKFCKKEFVGMVSLKRHMKRAHKDRNRYKYNCVYCRSMFAHPSKLFGHFFTRHKGIEPYTCKICNKNFRLRKNFTFHIKLIHKSVGFVEFDKNKHAIFTDKKSENPIETRADADEDSITDISDDDEKIPFKMNLRNRKKAENNDKKDDSLKLGDAANSIRSDLSCDINTDLEETSSLAVQKNLNGTPSMLKQSGKKGIETEMITVNSPEHLTDDNDDIPLSNIRVALLKEKTLNIVKRKRRRKKEDPIRDKRAKLTCKICNKYCYTVQNYHHHSTLHEKTKLKRCIKCQEFFNSWKELKTHIATSHSSSKLTETLKSLLEKRKRSQPASKFDSRPGESLKSLLEKRKKTQLAIAQNRTTNKFRQTIKRVDVIDDCVAKITPMSDHGLSVKNFIENFRPELDNVSISNSVTIKALSTPVNKEPLIKLKKFIPEALTESYGLLRFPVEFKNDYPDNLDTKIDVKLVQQLITKPKLVNMVVNERIPVIEDKTDSDEYCNMFADETDYTQYKNDTIPEVAHEVLLQDTEDIPRTRRLEQEIIIPRIPKEHGGVRIGHLLPQAPYYKIVEVKKLLEPKKESETELEATCRNIKLPDGTQLVSVKNPYAHLIPNEHLQEILKANSNRYYRAKTKNIESALAKALRQTKPPSDRRGRRRFKIES